MSPTRPTRYEVYCGSLRLRTRVTVEDGPLGSPRRIWLDESVVALIHPGDEITVLGGWADGKLWTVLKDAVVRTIEQPVNGRVVVHVGPKKE